MTRAASRFVQARSLRCGRMLMFGIGLVLSGHGAFAQTTEAVRFSISAQPLAAALDAYSAASGLEIFYDGELALGRSSSPVDGVLPRDVALRELLVGTGLLARATGGQSFTIALAPRARPADTAHLAYFAAVQKRVSEILCAHADTRPSSEDLLIQIWVATSGTVRRAKLLDAPATYGDDNPFARALDGASIGVAPPDGMPQPITMAVLARGQGEPTGCTGYAARGAAR